jgi:simple sugar transport system ATP-binding protein
MAGATVAVRLSGITRSFGPFRANDGINLEIAKGSIHAVVGENGAGKSTLSNILYGLLRPDSGTIELEGRPVRFNSPAQAIAAGVGMVHQHFMLIPTLTVAENIVLGSEKAGLFNHLSRRRIERELLELSRRHGMEVDPSSKLSTLPVGEQQRVEILKVLYRDARVLILDEPTAVLSPAETGNLFNSLRAFAAGGRSVLLVTHKLDEVLAVSDLVSVMRRGRLVSTLPTATTTKEELARLMVGRDVLLRTKNPAGQTGEKVLQVEGLDSIAPDGRRRLHGLSFHVRAGEVYGIAGVEGNGQSELLALLRGTPGRRATVSGHMSLGGTSLAGLGPAEITGLGMSMVPEDRLSRAVITGMGIEENLLLGRHRETAFHRGIGFDRKALSKLTARIAGDFDIRFSLDGNPPLSSLSGGNQQKLVLARELERPGIRLLVLAQPTRGVDIGAIEQIHRRIIDARQRGLAILLISSEIGELIALSTRIGCIYDGTIRHEFSEEQVRAGRAPESGFEKEIGLHIT